MNERITAFISRFRLTGRQWLVAGAALFMAAAVFWVFWGGFDIQIGRFFANQSTTTCGDGNCDSWEADPVTFCAADCGGGGSGGGGGGGEVSGGGGTSGGGGATTASVNPTASTASCGSKGGTTCTGRDSGGCPSGLEDKGKTTDCDSGYGYCCGPAGGGGGGGTVGGTGDGACVFEVRDNAPEGAWFCNDLRCQLDGNPSGGKEYPPKGPASSLSINVYNRSEETPNPALGPVFVRYILDSTPKCSGGGECYPPKDPLWTCTRPDGKEVDQGRNGHDFYDCYKPILRIYDYVPVTCCANTGLSGDCITLTAGGAGPSSSPEPTPTPEPLFCDPSTQTIAEGGIARATARGGDKRYTWEITGGGQLIEGGMETISVKYPVYGTKGLSVRSAGLEAVCTVVVTGGPTATPVPGDGDLSVTKTGFISGSGGGGTSFIEVSDGQTAEFIVRIENNGEDEITGIVLTDEVPEGMSYEEGSTKVEGLTISNDSIVDTGLVLGRLDQDDAVTVRWRATADRVGELPPGPALQHPTAVVEFDDGDDIEADMDVNVYGTGENLGGTDTGGSGGAAVVGTGPGGATLMAMLAAAAAALLYAGYTRSDAYHRREVERMTRERDPLDFRS